MKLRTILPTALLGCAVNGGDAGSVSEASTTAVSTQLAELAQQISDLQSANEALDARVLALENAQSSGTCATGSTTATTGKASGAGVAYFDDVVFEDVGPVAWTELDLGAWTGGVRALAMLQATPLVEGSGISPRFREIGATLTPTDGLTLVDLLGTDSTAFALVETDDQGRVEWSDPQGARQELRIRAVIQ